MIPERDPVLGVDYDELVEVHSFKEVDEMQVKLREENCIPDEKWVVEAFGSAFHWNRSEQFIGWRLKKKDGKRIWMRISMLDLMNCWSSEERTKDAKRS